MVDTTITTKVNADAIISPKRGTIFVAPADSKLPTDMTKFLLNTDTVDPWHNLGHTSADNLPTFDKSGGETTSYSTWLQANARTKTEDVTYSMTAKSIQADTTTLKLIFSGWDGSVTGAVAVAPGSSTRLALLVFSYDTTAKNAFGVYVPRATVAPDGIVDLSTDFAEFGFTATFEASPSVKPNTDGTQGTFEFLPAESFKVKAGA